MQKTYCDICKTEIKQTGVEFSGAFGKVEFKITAKINQDNADASPSDLCLGCTIKAINSEASKKLKRSYKRVAKQDLPAPVPNTDSV